MENEKKEEEVKDKKDPIQPNKEQKYKIMKNKAKNNLMNQIAYLIYNKNNFEEKLNPSDLLICLDTESYSSSYLQINYKTRLYNGTFNPKRDLVKNIKLYKLFPAELELNDEYYQTELGNIIVDLFPKIQKGIQIDLSEFPFYTYDDNNKLNKIVKEDIKSKLECKENEYILCIYFSEFSSAKKENLEIIKNLFEEDNFDKYFKNVFVIIQKENMTQMQKIEENDVLKEYLNKNDESKKDKKKINFLFNILSNYNSNNEDSKNNLINIFEEKQKIFRFKADLEPDYFFILDNNQKIVKIKPLEYIGKIISLLLLQFKKNKEGAISIFLRKENRKKELLEEIKKIIYFITNIQKLDLKYIFDLKFSLSFTLKINDEFTNIKLTDVEKLNIEGLFFTKEYKYLKQLTDSINLPFCRFELTEMYTIDIDVDFTKTECEKCKKIITEEEFLYFCFKCKIMYCFECVQTHLKNNKGKARYLDQKHNLLFFKTRDKEDFLNIEERKLGKNLFAESTDNNLGDWRRCVCNGCRNNLDYQKDICRYLCLSCRKGKKLSGGYVDFCSVCIDKMCKNKKDMENLEKTPNEIMDDWSNNFLDGFKFKVEHKHEKHIYLLLPFSVRNSDDAYYFF